MSFHISINLLYKEKFHLLYNTICFQSTTNCDVLCKFRGGIEIFNVIHVILCNILLHEWLIKKMWSYIRWLNGLILYTCSQLNAILYTCSFLQFTLLKKSFTTNTNVNTIDISLNGVNHPNGVNHHFYGSGNA